MLEPIRPISKKNQVAAALKEAILAGEVQPGSPLVESRIAQQLGAGIPLVREALIELEHQGFVQRVPYKGTRVTRLEPEDVRGGFRLRCELEALAVEWAKGRATDADLAHLREKVESMKRAAESLDLVRFYECDLAFHRKLWQLSGNPYLADTLERVVVPLFAFFLMKYRREREVYVESAAAHARLVEALPALGGAELRELTREVAGNWQQDALGLLFAEEDGAPARGAD